jgi:hypothetical protein
VTRGAVANDLTGRTFGRWTVLCRAEQPPHIITYRTLVWWQCRCRCGTKRPVQPMNLLNGRSRSCGCLRVEANKTAEKRLATAISNHLRVTQ